MFEFLGDNVETRSVKMLNGDIIYLQVNPFNYQGHDELKEMARILVDQTQIDSSIAHRVRIFKVEADEESGFGQPNFDYCCLIETPKVDHFIQIDKDTNHMVINFKDFGNLLDFFDFFSQNSNEEYFPDTLEMHFNVSLNEEQQGRLGQLLGKHFFTNELYFYFENNFELLPSILIGENFNQIKKLSMNAGFSLPMLNVISEKWPRLVELNCLFHVSMLDETYYRTLLNSPLMMVSIVYVFNFQTSLRQLARKIYEWRDFQTSVYDRGNNSRLFVVYRN